jgi:hypothetical protein
MVMIPYGYYEAKDDLIAMLTAGLPCLRSYRGFRVISAITLQVSNPIAQVTGSYQPDSTIILSGYDSGQ